MALQPAKVFSNPLRARILKILKEGAASPAQLAERVGEDLSRVAYHVAVLTETGYIRPVKTRKARGVVERFYEPVPGP